MAVGVFIYLIEVEILSSCHLLIHMLFQHRERLLAFQKFHDKPVKSAVRTELRKSAVLQNPVHPHERNLIVVTQGSLHLHKQKEADERLSVDVPFSRDEFAEIIFPGAPSLIELRRLFWVPLIFAVEFFFLLGLFQLSFF